MVPFFLPSTNCLMFTTLYVRLYISIYEMIPSKLHWKHVLWLVSALLSPTLVDMCNGLYSSRFRVLQLFGEEGRVVGY